MGTRAATASRCSSFTRRGRVHPPPSHLRPQSPLPPPPSWYLARLPAAGAPACGACVLSCAAGALAIGACLMLSHGVTVMSEALDIDGSGRCFRCCFRCCCCCCCCCWLTPTWHSLFHCIQLLLCQHTTLPLLHQLLQGAFGSGSGDSSAAYGSITVSMHCSKSSDRPYGHPS